MVRKSLIYSLIFSVGLINGVFLEKCVYEPRTIDNVELTPESLERVYQTYDVRYGDLDGIVGLCNWFTKDITLEKELSPDEASYIYIHESLHAEYPKISERSVRLLTEEYSKDPQIAKKSRQIINRLSEGPS